MNNEYINLFSDLDEPTVDDLKQAYNNLAEHMNVLLGKIYLDNCEVVSDDDEYRTIKIPR